jgi:hydroxyacylglutathione hydrolase
MEVVRIVNKPVDSNSFVVYQKGESGCIIVDPGTVDNRDLLDFIESNGLKPEFIFLTHEHFDHIWGVNQLKDAYSCKIVCSKSCAERIIDKKKNMSVFYDQVGFQTYTADINMESIGFSFIWNGLEFKFLETKGHTEGSICISVENNLFTGDTIIKDHKTVVKFPTGSKANLIRSLDLLHSRFHGEPTYIYPGHGESFFLNEISFEQIL